MTITAAPTTVATEVQDDIEGKVWIASEVWVMSTRAGRFKLPGLPTKSPDRGRNRRAPQRTRRTGALVHALDCR
jgi:hypothetical protein